MEAEQLQPSPVGGVKVSKRRPARSVVGAAKFSPKLELTKVHVAPVAWRRLQRTTRSQAMSDRPAEQAMEQREESSERYCPLIVSFPLTVSLQQFIAKALKKRKKELEAHLRKRKRAVAKSVLPQKCVLSPKMKTAKQPTKKKLLTNCMLPCSSAGEDCTTRAIPNTAKEIAQMYEEPAVGELNGQLGISQEWSKCNGEMSMLKGAKEGMLVIQPSTIDTFQPSKKRKISLTSKVAVVDSDRETGHKLKQQTLPFKRINKKKSNSVSDKHPDFNSSGDLKAGSNKQSGFESTASVPIISDHQTEIISEMNVFTTSTVYPTKGKTLSSPAVASSAVGSNELDAVISKLTEDLQQLHTKIKSQSVGRPRKNRPAKKLLVSAKPAGSVSSKNNLSVENESVSKPRKCPKKELNNKGAFKFPSSPVELTLETESEHKAKGHCRKQSMPQAIKLTVPKKNTEVVNKSKGRCRKRAHGSDKDPKLVSESQILGEFDSTVSEDSGYPSSCTNSGSPTDCVLTSPIILQDNINFLNEESLQEASNPVLRDSNLGVSRSDAYAGSDVTDSQLLEVIPSCIGTDLIFLRDIESGCPMGESMGMEKTQSSTENIFADLDLLLGQDLNPDELFSLEGNTEAKLGTPDEVEDILQSPSVSNCLKDLQLAGALPCEQTSQSAQVNPPGQLVGFNQSAAEDNQPAEMSTEMSDSACNSKMGVDDCPSDGGPQKTVIKMKKLRGTKNTVISNPDPSSKSKSRKKLKRTWKVCLDKDKELDGEDDTLVGKSDRGLVIKLTRKDPPGGKSKHSQPPVCPAEPGSTPPRPPLDKVMKISSVTNMGEASLIPQGSQTGGSMNEVGTKVDCPREKPTTTKTSETSSVHTFKLKLKKHPFVSQHPSVGGCMSDSTKVDCDKADLPYSNTSPVVNATKEPTPPAKEVNNANLLGVDPSNVEEDTSSKSNKGVMSDNVDCTQISTFNGFVLPATTADANDTLFSGNRASTGSIFDRNRVGSIFSSTVLATGSSSNSVPCPANVGTTACNSQPNPSSVVPTSTVSTGLFAESVSKRKVKLPPSNSLSMSLGTVLKQMDEMKRNNPAACVPKKEVVLHSKSVNFSSSAPSSGKDLVLPSRKAKVSFGEINYKSPPAYSKFLSSSEISNLILAPLNVGETLEEELKGECLFATNFTDSSVESMEVTKSKKVADSSYIGVDEGITTLASPEQSEGKLTFDQVEPPHAVGQIGKTERARNVGKTEDMKEQASPPVVKKIQLSVSEEQGGSEMEDCIDLFPDDDDLLCEDTSEEPLAKIFSKCTKPSAKDADQVQMQAERRSPEPHQCHSPVPLSDGGFESSFEKLPAALPYKKQQVSQWVADQQKRTQFPPQTAFPPSLHPSGSDHKVPLFHHSGGKLLGHPKPTTSSGNSHLMQHSTTTKSQDNGSAAAFAATDLPPGRSTPSQESDSYSNNMGWVSLPAPTKVAPSRQFCRYYILQRSCPLRKCRFAHCPRESAPARIVEEFVFRQPVEKISAEELKPYVADHQSYCILIKNFSLFVDMIKSLMDKRFVAVVNPFLKLLTSGGVKFSTSFLCRLMEMCASQYPSLLPPFPAPHPTMSAVGEELLVAIEESRGHLIPEDYQFFISTLVNFNETQRLSTVYRAMKDRGLCPTSSTLFVLLRFVKILDDSVIPLLLSDLKTSQFSYVEKASYVSRLVESMDPLKLDMHSAVLGKWLSETSPDVTMKLSSYCCDYLFEAFVRKAQWSHVVELFNSCSRYVHELGARVCNPLSTALQQLGPVVKLISVAEILMEDQIARMSTEFWETVLSACVKQRRTHRISFICSVLHRRKKQVSIETISALSQLLLEQGDLPAATSVFMESLQQDPALISSYSDLLVVSVVQAMEKTKDIHNVYVLVKLLLDQGISPPPVVLQSMLSLYIAEKQSGKLADLIKMAGHKGITLSKGFCEKTLVELRYWGRDPDAISVAYKFLRKFEGIGGSSVDVLPAGRGPSPVGGKGNHDLRRVINLRHSTSVGTSASSPPPPPPAPPPPRQKSASGGSDNSISGIPISVPHRKEGVNSPGSEKPDFSILKLIEENGSKGQFGAVASILTDLPDSTDKNSCDIVYSVWKGIVSAEQRAVSGFSNLVKNLDHHRTAKSLPAMKQVKPGSSLLPSDRWLISQVAIALLKTCDCHQNWENGFLLLHNLHFYGIHYVKFSQPSSHLPPFQTCPPSPCEVALLAVRMCLEVGQVDGALEVLRGCDWIRASSDDELRKRTDTLCNLTKKCLDVMKLQDAWKCLEKIVCGEKIVVDFVNVVTNLHNRLLQDVLKQQETSFALSIHSKMKHCKLQCLPSVFSSLLQHLCDKKQVKLARDLCKTAISEDAYSPLVTSGDIFKAYLSPGLVGVEIHLLIENHLQRLAAEVDKDSMKTLIIQFYAGSRHLVEQVLTQFIKPALEPVFVTTNSATVSVPSLLHWCSANCWDRSEDPVVDNGEQIGPATPVGQTSHSSEIGEDHNVCDNGDIPGSGTGTESVPMISKLGHESTERKILPTVDVGCAAVSQQLQGKGELWKDFKRAICNAVLNQIKPYYKEKFSTKEDYLHLFRVLSQNCSRLYKANMNDCFIVCSVDDKNERVLSDSVLHKISEVVSDLMSRCHVYSRQLDEELGLTSGCSSD